MSVFGLVACGTDSGPSGAPDMTATSSGTSEGAVETESGAESGGSTGDTEDTGEPSEPFVPGQQVLPRLTQRQYRNAVGDLFGAPLPDVELEPDTNPYLFTSIGATSTSLSELGTQQYEEAADALTSAVWGDAARRDALVGCTPASADDACAQGFLGDFGRRAFRRPLSADELARWTAVAVELSSGGSGPEVADANRGLRLAVAGMLQSPYFLYRVELGEEDPDDPSRLRFTGYELASRLSFLLWESIPDDELMAAAEDGALLDADGLEQQARRMMADPRTRLSVQAFFGQYFDLSRLDGVSRDPTLYPDFSPTMAKSMRTEVELLVEDLVYRQDADIRQLFSTRRTFVNTELAELYGITPPQGASEISFAPADLPADGPRAGMLTLGAFLAMNAHETETSPTLRGKYLRERVLCMEVPAPPDDTDTNVPDPSEGGTLRERLEQHRSDPACAACHAFIDPPGFLFENFDSAGVLRATDNGHPVDTTGELDGVPLADASELADVLAQNPFVGPCVVKQLFRHTNGRLETDGEQPALDDLSARFSDRGHRFSELLVQLVRHESFRYVTLQTEEGS
ncbi:MAG: DUF1592 domain-containing protein [Nannocystales bacterium]